MSRDPRTPPARHCNDLCKTCECGAPESAHACGEYTSACQADPSCTCECWECREVREAAPTRRLARPEPAPLPAAWTAEAGQYVHASGALSFEAELLDTDDVTLDETERTARDVVDLVAWRRRNRALERWSAAAAAAPAGPEEAA